MAISLGSVDSVFLNPGDFHFHQPVVGRMQPKRLRTLLGSCVGIVLWHPERRLGAMAHAILPSRSRPDGVSTLDARYCDEAIARFKQEALRAGTLPPQYQVYLVGGGQMYVALGAQFAVGQRNIDAARTLLKEAGFVLRAEHVGTEHHRKVELDLQTGAVNVVCNNKPFPLS